MTIAAAIVSGALGGCQANPGQAFVGKAMLPECSGVIDATPGVDLVVLPGDEDVVIPDGKVIRIAADRDVTWGTVRGLRDKIVADGRQAVLLVGVRTSVHAFHLSDPLQDPKAAMQVTATIDGKACVSPPGVPEAKCVQRGDKKHISRAFTRELVREAMKAYQLTDVAVQVPDDLGWADVIRTIDGARTCCGDTKMRVFLIGE